MSVTEIKEYRAKDNEIVLNEFARWDPTTDQHIIAGESTVLKRIADKRGISLEDVKLELKKRKVVLSWMIKKGMRRYLEIGTLLREFYADSDGVFKRALVESLSATSQTESGGLQ